MAMIWVSLVTAEVDTGAGSMAASVRKMSRMKFTGATEGIELELILLVSNQEPSLNNRHRQKRCDRRRRLGLHLVDA